MAGPSVIVLPEQARSAAVSVSHAPVSAPQRAIHPAVTCTGSDLSAPARAAASATFAALSAVVSSIGSPVTRSRR